MDINKIISNRSDKIRVHFIRYLKQPNWYFLKAENDRWVFEFILKSHHLPPYENSGYKDMEVEWAFALENENAKNYCEFLKHEIGVSVSDEDESVNKWIGNNGWYEFKDIANTGKWTTDYYSFKKEKEKKRNHLPVQQTLF